MRNFAKETLILKSKGKGRAQKFEDEQPLHPPDPQRLGSNRKGTRCDEIKRWSERDPFKRLT
jgi:hypothetical protein